VEEVSTRDSRIMRIRYKFEHLSPEEKEFWEAILLEEMDMQKWFVVACVELLGGEMILSLQ
jgi:hypothetical protein